MIFLTKSDLIASVRKLQYRSGREYQRHIFLQSHTVYISSVGGMIFYDISIRCCFIADATMYITYMRGLDQQICILRILSDNYFGSLRK